MVYFSSILVISAPLNLDLVSQVVVTDVHFAVLTEYEISQYVLSEEPMGKAGAYGIQGKAALRGAHLG